MNSPTPPAEFIRKRPARTGSSDAVHSVIKGALSFGLVSVLAYSIWAFRLVPGTAALYFTTAAVYVGLAGLALSRLVRERPARRSFPLLFAAGFLAYAACWCAFWFGLNGKYRADLWGAAAGLAALTWVLQRGFGAQENFLPRFAVLFTFHTLGYTLGEELYAAVRGTNGRLLWGAAHGFGFGAGLGYLLYQLQTSGRAIGTSDGSRASSRPAAHN